MTTSDAVFIDSHFHLDVVSEKGITEDDVFNEASKNSVLAGIDVGLNQNDHVRRSERVRAAEGLFGYSLGLYPNHAEQDDITPALEDLDSILAKAITDDRLLALGEFGMDFYWNYGTNKKQRELFEAQIQLANKYNLPVIIHNRNADKEILNSLKNTSAPGIMHCYSSSADTMKDFLDLGLYISFAGNLTFKNSHNIQDAARQVPLDRVLFETDSPFLAPVPRRGRTNTPANVIHVYEYFARLKSIDIGEVKQQVLMNFTRAVPRFEALTT